MPIEHTESCANTSLKTMDEIESFKASLRRMYRADGMEMMCFERCIQTRGANHTHIQVYLCVFSTSVFALVNSTSMIWHMDESMGEGLTPLAYWLGSLTLE